MLGFSDCRHLPRFKLIVVENVRLGLTEAVMLKVLTHHQLPTWLSSIAVADVDHDGQDEVVIGCHDNSIHGLKISLA